MKRSTLTILGLLVMAFTFAFTSCSKKEASPVELDTSKTGLLTGIVETQLDLLNDSTSNNFEFAPANTKIIFEVENSEYLAGAEGSQIYETKISSNGSYSISIPTIAQGVTVKVIPVDFAYEQLQRKFEDGHWVADGTIRKVYDAATFFVTIYPGGTDINDIFYANN